MASGWEQKPGDKLVTNAYGNLEWRRADGSSVIPPVKSPRKYVRKQTGNALEINVSDIKLDVSGIKKLMSLTNNLPAVDVGYFGGQKHPKWDLTFAEIATINHFGVRGHGKHVDGWFIPPRPAMKFALQDHTKRIVGLLQTALTSTFHSQSQVTANNAMKKVGDMMADRVNLYTANAGTSGLLQRNADATIDKKGKDDPLNWTGAFSKAAKFRLVRNPKLKK